MSLDQIVFEIYSKKLSKKYDNMQKHMIKYKKIAIDKSSIRERDFIVVVCCGTGLDFEPIEVRIGQYGKIIRIDFSKEMLMLAEKKIETEGWNNITLLQEDITKFNAAKVLGREADNVVCTLGLSIIENYQQAYRNIYEAVRKDGQIIIGDMQSARGIMSLLNPLTILLSKPFGGSEKGHDNSRKIREKIEESLYNVKINEYLFRSYFIAWGLKK